MRGNLRRKTRPEAQREIPFEQESFEGGWCNDLPGGDLPKDSMALLENFIAYPEYLEGRSGCQKHSATALPGSGTVYALKQHPTSRQWVLHRGSKLYYAAASMASWTEVAYCGSDIQTPTIAGDAGSQLSSLLLWNLLSTNSNAGVLYWNLTNSGSTRTLNVYSNSGKTTLVGVASRAGDGLVRIIPQGNYGLDGLVIITYSGDDTTAGNTFTGTANYNQFRIRTADAALAPVTSTLTDFDTNMLLFAYDAIYMVDLTYGYYFVMNSIPPQYVMVGSGAQGASTAYGYRYLYTYSRITSLGAVDYSKDRISGNLIQETGAVRAVDVHSVSRNDYAEYWVTNPITVSNSNTLIMTASGTSPGGTNLGWESLADPHLTHFSLYRTLDIGASGVDPITGSGNNREIYVWVGDFPIYSETIVDTKTDDELRARFSNGFGLQTRFFTQVQSGSVGAVTPNFLYSAVRGQPRVDYSQLLNKAYAGSHQDAFQYFKLNDGLQVIAKSPDMVSLICGNKTYISSPNSYQDTGGDALGAIYVLQHLTLVSDSIGCSDWGSFALVDSGSKMTLYGAYGFSSYIAHCSDQTIRIWNNSTWSDDLSSRKVNKIVQLMVSGSVGAYNRGAYLLWYRTDSGQTNNNLCLRFGMNADQGFGWTKVTGSAWPVPPLNTGAGSFLDTNSVQRLLVYDAVDTYSYWVETFTGYTGSGLTKVFKDKVGTDGTGGTDITCKARWREVEGPEEDDTLFHKETHLYDRPYDEASGYMSGMQRNLLAYIGGSSTAASTLTNVPNKGDLQFFDLVSDRRIQLEAQYTTSGVRLTGMKAFFSAEDKTSVGVTPSNFVDATAQADLAQGMTHWLTRPYNLLNRATGTSYTLTGTAPTNITSPAGRSFGLSFVSGASYSLADATSYTDFTVHFWVQTPATASRIFQVTGTNSFYVQFASNTSLSINGAGSLTVSTIAAGWHDFWIVRSGSTITAYQNGALLSGTVTVATARGGTSFDINPDGAAMSLFDIRAYNAAKSAADIAYYYADVNTTLQGNKVLPLA